MVLFVSAITEHFSADAVPSPGERCCWQVQGALLVEEAAAALMVNCGENERREVAKSNKTAKFA